MAPRGLALAYNPLLRAVLILLEDSWQPWRVRMRGVPRPVHDITGRPIASAFAEVGGEERHHSDGTRVMCVCSDFL
jgi:hypothetical protein